MSQAQSNPVRFIGSRELHRDLPKVLNHLSGTDARYVLTIHSKPKAVLIGADSFLKLLQEQTIEDQVLAAQLAALVQSLGQADPECGTEESTSSSSSDPDFAESKSVDSEVTFDTIVSSSPGPSNKSDWQPSLHV